MQNSTRRVTMHDHKFALAIFMIYLFILSSNSLAATLSIDLDPDTTGIQTSYDLALGSELDFEVVFTGDGVTQFDTFALDVIYNNPAFSLHNPVVGSLADGAPMLAMDIYAGRPVNVGDLLTPGNMPTALGFDGGFGGVGYSSIGGMAFPLLAEGETIGLFQGSLIATELGSGTLALTGFPFGAGAELSLAGESVLVDLEESTVQVVPLPPAIWLFVTGVLAMLGVERRKGCNTHRTENHYANGWLHHLYCFCP
jgi:hypothetical protein